jgi:tyrosinase
MGECVDDIMQPTVGADPSKADIVNHNRVHFYLGGIFKPSSNIKVHGQGYLANLFGLTGAIYGTILPATAPNDPVFWLLHSNVDRVWATWQVAHPDGYEPKENGPNGQNLDDTMPFFQGVLPTFTIRSVQDINRLGYSYN